MQHGQRRTLVHQKGARRKSCVPYHYLIIVRISSYALPISLPGQCGVEAQLVIKHLQCQPAKTNTVRRQWSLCGRCQPGSLDVWPRFRVKLLSWCLLSALFWCHWEGYNTWSHFGWNKVKIFDIFIKISVSLFPLSKCCETEVTQPTAKSKKQCWVGVPWEITSGILFSLLGFCDWLMNPRLLHCWKIMTLNVAWEKFGGQGDVWGKRVQK